MKPSIAESTALRAAARSDGVLAWRELSALGVSPALARRLVRAGEWSRPHCQTYILGPAVSSPLRATARAALLAAPPGAIASHALAGQLHRLAEMPAVVPPEVTIASGHGARSLHGLIVHRAQRLDPAPFPVQGFPATSAACTLADVAYGMSLEALVCAIDSALTAESVTLQLMEETAVSRDKRPGVDRLREATRLARAGSDSPLESRLRLVIDSGGLPVPELQIRVGVDGRTFRIDLGYPSLRLGIEADGRAYHGSAEALLQDRRRQNALSNAGWLLLRFTWDDVINRPGYVVATVAQAVQTRGSWPAKAALSS